jgi:hypothetical protein
MSTYRLLGPHSVGGYYFATGSTQSTSDVGGLLPTSFVPSGNCEPTDNAAVTAFTPLGRSEHHPPASLLVRKRIGSSRPSRRTQAWSVGT